MRPLASSEGRLEKRYYRWSGPAAIRKQRRELIADKRAQRRIDKQQWQGEMQQEMRLLGMYIYCHYEEIAAEYYEYYDDWDYEDSEFYRDPRDWNHKEGYFDLEYESCIDIYGEFGNDN